MLTDKVVIVTGGAGLIGREFCFSIAKERGFVVVADKDLNAAKLVSNKINEQFGSGSMACSVDITREDSILELIEVVKNSRGKIDALVNNAYPRNKNFGQLLEKVTYEDFCENTDLHLGGYFLMSKLLGSFFKNQGFGNIVNISSVYGVVAPRFHLYESAGFTMPVEYAAIKSAINQLTVYFAQYFKKHGVRVNCLSPGGVLDRQPQEFVEKYRSYCGKKGMLEPKDICPSLIFLLSDGSRYINGHNLIVDDGFTL